MKSRITTIAAKAKQASRITQTIKPAHCTAALHTFTSKRTPSTRSATQSFTQSRSFSSQSISDAISGLTPSQLEFRDAVRKFAEKEIAPLAAEIDRKNEFPMHLWREMGSMGLLGATAPAEYGGSELGYLDHVMIMEEISRASGSVGLSYGAHFQLVHQSDCS